MFLGGLDLFCQSFLRLRGWGVENRGVSFGLADSWGLPITVLLFCLLTFLTLYFWLKNKRLELGGWLMLVGGWGNVLNRLIYGSVWDYLNLPLLPFSFNLSDVMICLGVVSYILEANGNRNSLRR